MQIASRPTTAMHVACRQHAYPDSRPTLPLGHRWHFTLGQRWQHTLAQRVGPTLGQRWQIIIQRCVNIGFVLGQR